MKTYEVTIKATIVKTLKVQAETAEAAEKQAEEKFTVECDGDDENYQQEILEVTQRS